MTEIGFYHLTRSTLAQALPQLLVRTLAAGQRALVLGPADGLEALSAALWAQPAWLPHGTAVDGDPDLQPIWLSPEPVALNGARFLFLVEGAETDRWASSTGFRPVRRQQWGGGGGGAAAMEGGQGGGAYAGLLAADRERLAEERVVGARPRQSELFYC